MKFSIIVPVYNVEKYLENCLDSILMQSYKNYEVIIVNDGTKDNSQDIIDKYVKKDKRFLSYIKENGGLSSARNYGVKKAKGDYLLFLDSDDSINCDLLKNLNDTIIKNKKLELIHFQIAKIIDNSKTCDCSKTFANLSGSEAFLNLSLNSLFVTAWSYAYEKNFFLKNNFLYANGKLHEDFGLTPLIILKSKNVSSIDYVGYNYYIRENSIMTDINKIKKRTEDILYHYDYLKKEVGKLKLPNYTKLYFNSFISNSLIELTKVIDDKKMLNEYLSKLKDRNISNDLLNDNYKRKIKKLLFKLCPRMYIKFIVKRSK